MFCKYYLLLTLTIHNTRINICNSKQQNKQKQKTQICKIYLTYVIVNQKKKKRLSIKMCKKKSFNLI